MDQGELLRRAQINALKEAMASGYGKVPPVERQGYFNWDAKTANDNIRKATTRAGAMFAKPTTLGEQAAGYLKTALPNFGGKALGFMASPWAASLGGIFAPTPMGDSEFIGSPEHQQWLARKGPLSKDWQ